PAEAGTDATCGTTHTRGMPLEAFFGADLERALTHVSIPAYVIDTAGVIRWINDAGLRIVGDVRGRQFTSLVTPAESRQVREIFAKTVVGTSTVTDFESVIVQTAGDPLGVEISSVPLVSGDRVVGAFGQVS